MVFIYNGSLLLNMTPQIRDEFGRFKRVHFPFSLDNFNDGYVDVYGRFKVYAPNHHRANKGYVFRSIIAYELYHNCIVNTNMVVHHKDGNTLNDSKENLELIPFGKHTSNHNQARIEESNIIKVCKVCKKEFIIKKWRLKDPTRGQYCSQKCFHNRKISEKTKERMSKSQKRVWEKRKDND